MWNYPQLNITYKTSLVQVMVWCHQITNLYLNQCWPRSLSIYGITKPQCVNTLRPRQNGWHFPENIFNCICLNGNVWILNAIWLHCVLKVSMDNNTALVQIMAWHRADDKPLSAPMMAYLGDEYKHHLALMSYIQSITKSLQWVHLCCLNICCII